MCTYVCLFLHLLVCLSPLWPHKARIFLCFVHCWIWYAENGLPWRKHLMNTPCGEPGRMKQRQLWFGPGTCLTYDYEWAPGKSQNENTFLNSSNPWDYICKGSQVNSDSLAWRESSLCRIKMIFHWAIRIWRLFLRSVSLMQVVKQPNKSTVTTVKFRNANFWVFKQFCLKHMANRLGGKFLHCCVCFYGFKHCSFMQEEIDFWDSNDRWNRMWKNDILDLHMSTK